MRFLLFPVMQIITIGLIYLGDFWPALSIIVSLLVYQIGDELFSDFNGNDVDTPWMPWIGYVVFAAMVGEFVALAQMSSRGSESNLIIVLAALAVGNHLGIAIGTAGHEFVHRTTSRIDRYIGMVLFALAMRPDMPVEHVFGHHRTVGTINDPTTAHRGEPFWSYLPRSIFGSCSNALQFEAKRLRKNGSSKYSWSNRVIQGSIVSLFSIVVFWLLCGWIGVVAVAVSAAIAVTVIELFNYVAHYGVIRVIGQPIEGRHSWNSFRMLSTSSTFNLSRHSDHHRFANRPYWKLQANPDVPVLPYGSGIMAIAALIPSLYFRIMKPRLLDWDNRFASEDERRLLTSV